MVRLTIAFRIDSGFITCTLPDLYSADLRFPTNDCDNYRIIIIVSAVAGSVVAIVLLFLCTFLFYKIIRISFTACWRKDILAQIRTCTDEQFKQKLLDMLQKTKVDSGDAESENGTEKKEEEETTSELAVDAIVGQSKNMDKSNSLHSPPNYVGNTAVNSAGDGMESIGQELQLRSLVTTLDRAD